VSPLVSPHLPGFRGWQAARADPARLTTLQRLPSSAVPMARLVFRLRAGGCVPGPASPLARHRSTPRGAQQQVLQRRRSQRASDPARLLGKRKARTAGARPGVPAGPSAWQRGRETAAACRHCCSKQQWRARSHWRTLQLARIGWPAGFRHELPAFAALDGARACTGAVCCNRAGQRSSSRQALWPSD